MTQGWDNPWAALGVRRDATTAEVRRAFRARVRHAHPDCGGDAAQFHALFSAYRAALAQAPVSGRKRTPYSWCFEAIQPLEAGALRTAAAAMRVSNPAAPSATPVFAAALEDELVKLGCG
jgi:hypothetical protein